MMHLEKRSWGVMAAVAVAVCLVFMPVVGHSTGDVDLDGVYNSISDFATFNAYFRVGIPDPGPWPPEESIAETDFNCDGINLSVADMVTLWRVIMADTEPCYGPLPPNSGGVTTATGNADAYTVRLETLILPGTDTGWMEIVMTEGTRLFSGAQFHIEYEADILQLLDVQPGPDFADWATFNYNVTVTGDVADVKLGLFAFDMENNLEISMPQLPTVLLRLKFGIVEDMYFTRPINFVWDECADNAIAVLEGPVSSPGAIPDFLAVSNFVFDPSGDDVTGSDDRYGGAGEDCLVGSAWNTPERFINFYGGYVDRWTSCCLGIRGNVDNDPQNSIDIADLTFLVEFMFNNGPEPECEPSANVDGVGEIDISDVTYLVQYFFDGGPTPPTCPSGE